MIKIVRRIGKGGKNGPVKSSGRKSCPDILELEDGDFLVIGTDVTNEYKDNLTLEAACADYEKIVKIPRIVLLTAKEDIPSD